MNIKIIFIVATTIFSLSSIVTEAYADGHEVVGDYEFGKSIAKTAYGRGCLGCHSVDKFAGSTANELMERIINSWHIAGFTEEDVKDLSVYLAMEANQ